MGDNDNDLPMLRTAKIGFAPPGSVAAGRDKGLEIVRDADHGCGKRHRNSERTVSEPVKETKTLRGRLRKTPPPAVKKVPRVL